MYSSSVHFCQELCYDDGSLCHQWNRSNHNKETMHDRIWTNSPTIKPLVSLMNGAQAGPISGLSAPSTTVRGVISRFSAFSWPGSTMWPFWVRLPCRTWKGGCVASSRQVCRLPCRPRSSPCCRGAVLKRRNWALGSKAITAPESISESLRRACQQIDPLTMGSTDVL